MILHFTCHLPLSQRSGTRRWEETRWYVVTSPWVDTFAASPFPSTSVYVGSTAESLKRCKLKKIVGSYFFEPFAVESRDVCAWGSSDRGMFKQVIETSRDQKAGFFLAQI